MVALQAVVLLLFTGTGSGVVIGKPVHINAAGVKGNKSVNRLPASVTVVEGQPMDLADIVNVWREMARRKF